MHNIPLYIIFSTCLFLLSGTCRNIPSSDPVKEKKLVNLSAEDLVEILWIDHAGRKEVIRKEDNQWHYAGMERVDSFPFAQYLNILTHLEGVETIDQDSTDDLPFIEKLTLYGSSMTAPTVISVFKSHQVEKPFLIRSSLLPESIFISDSTGIYKQIFKDLRQFWPNGQ